MTTKRATRKTPPKATPPLEEPVPQPTASTEAVMLPAFSGIKIRMYRQGLGDCFLITLPGKDRSFYLVIDCGVVLGTTSQGIEELTKAVKDISSVTKNQIDLLVLTHEHWDHVSGFIQAKDLIEKVWDVKQVWTAWTEDRKDPLANKLRAERKNTEDALRLSLAHLAAMGATDQYERVDSLVGFMGAASGSTSEALEFAKKLGEQPLRFCQPGEDPIELPDMPGLKFYILGPPKNEALIRKSNPGKGEAYGLDVAPIDSNGMFLNALKRGQSVTVVQPSTVDSALDDPFETRFQIPTARAQHLPFFDQHYSGELQDESLYYFPRKSDNGKVPNKIAIRDQSWRRIDGTWLSTSETLALALDAATNNTSLVIAIEVVATGKVLLFPGDAQAGNWLSWQDLAWPPLDPSNKDDKKMKRVTGPDLLARTVFYKVGHHGSHNATLSEKGLELMTEDDLVAMIPVDHDMAVKKRWGKMPLEELVERLKVKTKGRVLRIDDRIKTAAELLAARPSGTDVATWIEFAKRVEVNELYFELALS